MKRLLLALTLVIFATTIAFSQPFTVHDLVTLARMPSEDISHFLYRNGFRLYTENPQGESVQASFIPKIKPGKNYSGAQKSVDYYLKDGARYFLLHTPLLREYEDGQRSLVKSGFVFDKTKDMDKDSSMLFQKENISVLAYKEVKDSTIEYIFKLREKKIPDSVVYAEDLIQFDSHAFLVSYFGEKNVRKDLYYFSEKELKKCSVLFSGTPYQVAFVWGDENNLNNLSYILVSNILPTKEGERNGILDGNNSWKFKCGIHEGMALKDVLRLNEMDFYIYGNKSDLAFMVNHSENGKINFKRTAIMFSCSNCYDNKIFDQSEISALDIAKANLPLRVVDIIIYP